MINFQRVEFIGNALVMKRANFSFDGILVAGIVCVMKQKAVCLAIVCNMLCALVTARKRSLGQGNIFSSVCQEFCSLGGSASVHVGIPPPPGADTPPEADLPWEQTPPCTLHAGRYGQQAGSIHSTGMQSCL